MPSKLEGVRPEHVALYWPHVSAWIGEAIRDCGHCWDLENVRDDLERRELQLWVIWNGAEMHGCICTQIYETPRGKTCAMPVVFCEDMAENIGVLDIIERWAKSQGCKRAL